MPIQPQLDFSRNGRPGLSPQPVESKAETPRKPFERQPATCEAPGCPKELSGRQSRACSDEHRALVWRRENVKRNRSTDRFGRWARFHRNNPRVWELFRRFAVEARERGRGRFGARMIGERIRWYTSVETDEESPKLNDHYWPYYARLLMLTDERFDGFFERRDTRFDVDDGRLREAHTLRRG